MSYIGAKTKIFIICRACYTADMATIAQTNFFYFYWFTGDY